MIEDKDLGLKIAENPEVAFWEETKKKCESEIKSCERVIIMDNHIIGLCIDKLKELDKHE
jgi:hypothetical protein